MLLQLAAAVWVITDTTDAARQGARAASMGQDGCAAAGAALSGAMPGAGPGLHRRRRHGPARGSAPRHGPGHPGRDRRRVAVLPDLDDL